MKFRAICLIPVCFLSTPQPALSQTSVLGRAALWGTDQGLYRRDQTGRVEQIWSGGKVLKIIQTNITPPSGNNRTSASLSRWTLLTDNGILVSNDLKEWEQRSQGLPRKVIKIFENGEKSFITTVQEIKDLEIDRENQDIMVCAVKDGVYLTRNGGQNWQNLGMPNFRSNGIKAVTTITLPGGDFTVLCSHSIYGVYYINPDKNGAKWIEMSDGLEKLETTDNADEVSDFTVILPSGVYASQSFRRRIYRLDWESKTWDPLWQDDTDFGTVDSLSTGKNNLRFVHDGGIMEIVLPNGGEPPPKPTEGSQGQAAGSNRQRVSKRQDLIDRIKAFPSNGQKLNCAVLGENIFRSGTDIISLSELWLLDEGPGPIKPPATVKTTAAAANPASTASGKDGLYLPVNHAMDPTSLKPYLDIIEDRKLNMVVIDMKDDYGRLRFTPENTSITGMGRVFRPVDIEVFLDTMRERGIYTVARIVVFKDPEAAARNGARYAVWDNRNNKSWEGYYDTRRKKTTEPPETNPALVTAILPDSDPNYEILRTWYDEKWVDPYSEAIWDYNASIAEELNRRGFDEIQFDYIRFPTDGANLADARFRWQEAGMDMDSAILSFLRHVRARVSCPISVDIYGANGWYRTGARTGQEVELLAPWVDVICPMYYPSHFEQDFLAHDPPEQRPYRIYYQGTKRTRIISRGRVIVRPWAQAFYLNVSYDRKYYNEDYVRLELEGVRAAGSGGLTYWNNSGRYEDIP